MVRATIYEKCIYASGVIGLEPTTKWTFGGGKLWVQRRDLMRVQEVTSLDYLFGIYGRRNALLRWQLVRGQYCCAAYHWASGDAVSRQSHLQTVPLADIELVNKNLKAPGLLDRRRNFEQLIKSGPHLNPVGTALGFGRSESFHKRVFFDIWCPEGKRLEVYVTEPPFVDAGPLADPKWSTPRNVNRLLRADYHPENKVRTDQDPKVQWQTVGHWTVDWEGPFYVAPGGDDRYIVTERGRVFAAPRNAMGGAGLKEVWSDKPVDVLIHDGDSEKWYAFTKDQYFEIADPIKPRPHAIAIRRAWTADQALETAAKCGRVIRGLAEPKGK